MNKSKAQSSKLKGSPKFQAQITLSQRGDSTEPRVLQPLGALSFELPLSFEL
jgi:hypothetical protein